MGIFRQKNIWESQQIMLIPNIYHLINMNILTRNTQIFKQSTKRRIVQNGITMSHRKLYVNAGSKYEICGEGEEGEGGGFERKINFWPKILKKALFQIKKLPIFQGDGKLKMLIIGNSYAKCYFSGFLSALNGDFSELYLYCTQCENLKFLELLIIRKFSLWHIL